MRPLSGLTERSEEREVVAGKDYREKALLNQGGKKGENDTNHHR